MATILVATVPVIGHVNPMVPIAQRLVQMGHEVYWYTGEKFRPRIEAIGATFVAMKQGLDYSIESNVPEELVKQRRQAKGIAQLRFDLETFFIQAAVNYAKDLMEFLEHNPADVVLADSFFLAAGWVHEMGGPVWAQLSISALKMPSPNTAPFGLGLPPTSSSLGALRNSGLYWLFKNVVFRQSYGVVNRARAELSLPAADTMLFDVVSPYLFLVGTVPSFEYPRPNLPSQMHFIGSSLPEPKDDFMPPGWWGDLEVNKPVVLVTQGTVATDPNDLIVPTLQALEGEDVLAIATTGSEPDALLQSYDIPKNARVERFIDYQQLLPHVDVMVTNGGYNGVQTALAHGVPLVTAGKSEDKPEVCARVAWSGVGVDLKTKSPSSEQVLRAVRQVLNDARFRENARRIQAEKQSYATANLAGDLVTQLADSQKPVVRGE